MSVPGPDGDVEVGQRAGAGEARVDVDDRRTALLGLHHPLEPDRMRLGHVRALDDDAVGVGQVLLESGGAAAAERSPQTGDGGGVSNAGLVLDLDRAQRGEELLDQVVLFVVERRAAQAGEARAYAASACRRSPAASRAGATRLPGRRSCPWPGRGRASSQSVPNGRRYFTLYCRALPVVSCKDADPLGQSLPRLTGESGSPSIWMTLSSQTYTFCAQPTAQ